ncbi:transposase [Candidatus Laterigemmans baculatus]|uniref:transposase n=1 Tax=Candidatus Laterigemmans baculatus TaxID=2770505 RepID=UPI0013DA22D1|nr:transposase [Candidatus Laterigemmans baculatus]
MFEPGLLGELFDPTAELDIRDHYRPHWSQAGAIIFVTFRTADSIPQEVIYRWEREKQDWMLRHGCPPDQHWSKVLPTPDRVVRGQFRKEFDRCREDFLDNCHGACQLRKRELAEIVSETLLHFDGDRYRMGDFIVMPNHVHLLAAFASEESLVNQCDSWLHFSARQINLVIGQKGKFWQQEPFDHLVRSPEQYEYLRRYIRDNGLKAGLPEQDYFYRVYEP